MKFLKIFEEFEQQPEDIFYKWTLSGPKSCPKGEIYDPNSNKCITKLQFINDRISDGTFKTQRPIDKYLMTEVVNILFRCKRIFIDAYQKSFHSRWGTDIPKISSMIELIEREVKYEVLDRAKPAIEEFLRFLQPQPGQSKISEVNKKSWLQSSDGRKWGSELGKFEVYLHLLSDLESTETIQIQLDKYSSNIFFYGNSTKIREYSESDINKIVDVLNKYQTIRVVIQGWHNNPKPDIIGLDGMRAATVKEMLKSKGINESRMTAEGKGESKIVPTNIYKKNKFGDDYNENMRVDIKIIK